MESRALCNTLSGSKHLPEPVELSADHRPIQFLMVDAFADGSGWAGQCTSAPHVNTFPPPLTTSTINVSHWLSTAW
eukprot:9498756-Pyramimonas_sp.AAC.1